jgi:hypothetical protein
MNLSGLSPIPQFQGCEKVPKQGSGLANALATGKISIPATAEPAMHPVPCAPLDSRIYELIYCV